MRRVLVIAHRGARAAAPENSLEAFRLAAAMGADMVEMDVRAAADGRAVIMHDESVDRTTDGSGKVSGKGLEELRGLRMANGEAVPTLAEALECLRGRCLVNLEMKDAASVGAACADVLHMRLAGSVLFSSFDGDTLALVREHIPDARTALLAKDRRSGYLDAARRVGAEAVCISARIASARAVEAAHGMGLAANIWTVNRPDGMRRAIALGADGIITDRPDVLLRVLGRPSVGL